MKIINIFAILFLFIFGRPEARNFRNLRRAMPAKWSQKHTPFGSRIVGGSQSSPGMYPFFVEWEGCGASLIYEDIILSAAHCNVIDTDEVLIGAFQRDSETYGAELRTVVERREHPGYSTYTLANDFLVMKIDQASTKEPVPLNANPSLPQENDDLLVMGLGVTSVRVVASEFLREVVLKAVSHETCSEQYGGAIVEDVMLCAAVPEGGKDSCQGDSGGPILDMDGNQVGVVSWGKGCGQSGWPGVYSKVSGTIDWINQQICELSDNPPASCQNVHNPEGDPEEDPEDIILEEAPDTEYDIGILECNENELHVDFTFTTDADGHETAWALVDSQNQIVVKGEYNEFQSDTTYNSKVCVPNDCYKLTLYDSYGDGFCCGKNPGFTLAVNGSTLYHGGSNDFLGEELNFVFGSCSELPQAFQETFQCQDVRTQQFNVDAEVGEQTCGWLAINLDRYDYLCQFLDVAFACPKTCDVCEYFE